MKYENYGNQKRGTDGLRRNGRMMGIKRERRIKMKQKDEGNQKKKRGGVKIEEWLETMKGPIPERFYVKINP